MSIESMRRCIIDMILWTDDQRKMKLIYTFLSRNLKKREGENAYE